ncbi:hypothetical protein B0H34DRAFT_847204 [Crassisporium funariophilum]|nr:hypothetical protein B0H34DRAFT_847204 [Crassisporium funariophilum]
MPSFLWPKDGYDCEQMEENMFRNPVLVMVWKHIFTCPSSALKDGPGRTKTRSSQAKMNKMLSVTPRSIAYVCLMLRHSISDIEDWRTEDKLFKREEFYEFIMALFDNGDDKESDWVKDTIELWNA